MRMFGNAPSLEGVRALRWKKAEMMKMSRIMKALLVLFFLALANAQTNGLNQPSVSTTKISGVTPSVDAYIVNYYIDEAPPGSRAETGNLHIVYSGKTEVVERLQAKQKSPEHKAGFCSEEKGITNPKIAPDKRTIGWTVNFGPALSR
jgi:hypothetical protein